MKNIIKNLVLACLFISLVTGCNEYPDFDFDGVISGTLKDESGNVVCGDLTNNTLLVRILGKGELIPMNIRVKGDGTFNNTYLNPNQYKIWIEGPVFPVDTIFYDMKTQGNVFSQEIIATPYLAIDKPEIIETTNTSITISYNINGNRGQQASGRVVYCSTAKYPSASIGSGVGYETITETLDNDSGQITIAGLTSGTTYYLRIGANVASKGMNFSDQIIFNTN